ncbi:MULTISPECIES: restriction endonuclease subunit S [unclassified Neisseria]|uniref:restriction endonuclease subunit S n=1 Tax=unclassified Neisseria TaxID=2623750 RepID=UPI0010719F47|nr:MULTISPECIES: restriction endonuclease subunit S [unclassified Neisseria]MBF0802974.1 restriction endonuclease subunit S [Neisseria sp. 19428wB4_WF04]TFU44500.1 restriction endonuclease subunit S [Neisseria sp. WF04]
MSEWREYKISDIADVIGGGTPKTEVQEYWNGNIPWITPKDLTNYKKVTISFGARNITSEGLKSSSARLLPKGSVLITSRAPIGYVAIAENEISTNQGFKSLALKEIANNYFIYYWVKCNNEYLQSIGTGTTFLEISGNTLKNISILLPPLPEQKAIADVLSALDDKIDLLHRQNHTLEQMAETLFRQWFVEEAREDWEEKPLSSIATFTNGLACQKFPVQIGERGLPVLKIKELTSGISDSSDWATETVKSEYIVENGDIIFAWSASLMVKIWSGQKCVLNQHLFNVKSKDYPKWFYYEWCKFHLAEFISVAQSHATTMGHIKRKDLDEAMVKIPSSETLATMSQTMKPLLDKRIVNSQQIQTLETLRDTLLPKLISGEVRAAFQTA